MESLEILHEVIMNPALVSKHKPITLIINDALPGI